MSCKISSKMSWLVPVEVNGQPGFAHYRASGPAGEHEPFALVVLDVRDGAVQTITSFLDTSLFDLFGLPRTPPR